MRRFRSRILTACCFALACGLPAGAAVEMTQTTVFHGYGPSHAGRSTSTSTTVVSGARSRSETTMEFEGKMLRRLTGEQVSISITDADAQWIRNLNPKNQTYTEMSFAEFKAQRDQLGEQLAALRGQAPPEPEEGSGPQMQFDPPVVSVTPAGSAKIAGYDARLLDALVKTVGRYPDSDATCEIHVAARLGFADTPGNDELRAFYAKLAEGLGLTRAQLLGAGQSALSAMGRYGEGFEKLYEEIKKQEGTLLRQELQVKVKGACTGPTGGQAAGGDDDEAVRPGARMKKMFGKLKLGRKKDKQSESEEPEEPAEASGDDEFTVMLGIDTDTDRFEIVADPGAESFRVPEGWKKIDTPGAAGE